MVNDGFTGGLEFDCVETSAGENTKNVVEDPKPMEASYYKLLESVNEPLFDGCSEFVKLSMASELLNLKAELDISLAKYERWVSVMQRLTPNKGATIPIDFYEVMKMLGPLFLPK
ncbi:hypothetical protein LIER_08336 [Lithospermum erythrorhizon]|uniref:Uncharacterized protein n=1 Tax=Lithospermum erythrorhizon TaxID=34254 RepID=A0AAV3PD73_LITER